ncbi:MAG: 2-oxoacid:acceptor oxidoreductase family protein [Halodesulfurarchaeum sp.]
MSRQEYRFSGFGGQGVITITHIVGRAATVHAGMHATMTEAYGPEKTGGFSRGDVVVSEDPIDYPAVIEPDMVVAFSQDAFERDADSVEEDGLVVVEENLVDPSEFAEDRPDVRIVEVPAVEIAEEVGRKVVANIVMLGAVNSLIGTPPEDAVREAILDIVPEGTEEMNTEAFERGLTALDREVVA